MSVEYYLACHAHKEMVHVCSDGFSGPQLQCDRSLAAFVITHRSCNVSIEDEHHVIDDPKYETYKEWRGETWKALLNYDQTANPNRPAVQH